MGIRSVIILLAAALSQLTLRADGYPANLWVGTGGYPHTSGNTFPGATLPFGMVRLSPDTLSGGPLGWKKNPPVGVATAGYRYGDQWVLGFSHTRLSGTGVRDGGLYRVLPGSSLKRIEHKRPRLRLSHKHETAEPGYYSVKFPSDAVRAELTASVHCGFHRYTAIGSSHGGPRRDLVAYLDATSELYRAAGDRGAMLSVNPDTRTITARIRSFGAFSARQGGLVAYLYGEYSGVGSHRLRKKGKWLGGREVIGDEIGVALEAESGSKAIELKLCLSYVSPENARLNFDAEARGVSFEDARKQASARWSELFSRAEVETRDPKLREAFYSFLYFSSVMPTHFSDVNGEYLGFGGERRVARDFIYRTDLSLWDTFRTAHPLYTLIAPEIQRDSLRSLLSMAEKQGAFPRWPFGAADSGSMFGSPANFLFSESYAKGERDFDVRAALSWMARGAREPEGGRPAICAELGYCPAGQVKASVSKTLEFAWADHMTADLARALGDRELEREFRTRSRSFRALWDPMTRFFRPRNGRGEFIRFKPDLLSYLSFIGPSAANYAEGSAHQWRYSAPHAARELIAHFGGERLFSEELEAFLSRASRKRSALFPGAYYWHGNEHDLHAIFLFNEAGRPELAQKWARWALRTRYAVAPNGLDGNDDGGTLSSWFVLVSLGLYPQAGTDRYWLVSPAVDRARLKLAGGRSLTISTQGQSPKNVYIQHVTVNGRPWCKPEIRHADLLNAHIEFKLGRKPAEHGGFGC